MASVSHATAGFRCSWRDHSRRNSWAGTWQYNNHEVPALTSSNSAS